MELNKNPTRFQVICNDEDYLVPILNWYNENYHTDFEVVNIFEDEVRFVEIEVNKFSHSDIFSLGYLFGVKEQKLRHDGKIDW